jgi:arginase family enzyme
MVKLAAEQTLFGIAVSERPRAVVLGAPLDVSGGCRDGGGDGPAAVRAASRALESYSPELDRDLTEVELADAGDLGPPDEIEPAVECVERAVAETAGLNRLPVLVGGEHTVSLGAVRALRRLHSYVAPDTDAGGTTALAAAKLLRELILLFA